MLGSNRWSQVLIPLTALLSGCAASPSDGLTDKQVGPYKQCTWRYENGLEPLKNSASTPGFDVRYNPFVTVSRRGLTVRVVGVLSDETLARFDGSLDRVVEAYPYLTPIRFTAVHRVRPDDISRSRSWRAANSAGEVIETTVLELPPNAVMLIYPASIAADGYNTAAGNWRLLHKSAAKPNSRIGAFGNFPFLLYTTEGHALHGPITGSRESNLWALRRGKVSHGCNRMEGEHVVELSQLLGCGPRGSELYGECHRAGESVTVMEELDHFPDPLLEEHPTGRVNDFDRISKAWVAPDISGVPRDKSYPIPIAWVAQNDQLLLMKTIGKAWSDPTPDIVSWTGGRTDVGVVRLRAFPTWDNRVTAGSNQTPMVSGTDCRP